MNRKQRKMKQHRANEHRKLAKTVEYKRKQSDAWAKACREHDHQLDLCFRQLTAPAEIPKHGLIKKAAVALVAALWVWAILFLVSK